MLTQEQANDYNIALHELEAIETGQQIAQNKMNEYYSAIEKVSSIMTDATPEMIQRARTILPKLVEGYNAAKLKLTSYEDRHQQALSKVNEYRALEAEPVSRPITRRRVVTPETVVPETVMPEATVSETPTTNPTSYRNDQLYPEFQEFLNWRNNKNNAYKTDPLYPEFQEFLKRRGNNAIWQYIINDDWTTTINWKWWAKVTVYTPKDFYEVQNSLWRRTYAPNYNTWTIWTYRYNNDGTASFVWKWWAGITVSSPKDFFETSRLLWTN